MNIVHAIRTITILGFVCSSPAWLIFLLVKQTETFEEGRERYDILPRKAVV